MHKVTKVAHKTPLSSSHPAVLGYYRSFVIETVGLIRDLEADPWMAGDKCLDVQIGLLQKTGYVENKIRATKAKIKSTRAVLGRRTSPILGEIGVSDHKKALVALHSKLDGYRRVLYILKDIGDALAFTYIDKYDIKPMRFKEASGFISGKSGLRKELLQLRRAFKLGGIGILNDLTHCLRYGDITAGYRGEMFATVEVKSGRKRGRRGIRQSEGIAKIADYLRTDQTYNQYGIDGEFYRLAVKGEEVHHRDKLDALICQARKYGFSWEEIENGLFYVVAYENNLDWMKLIGKRCKGKPMFAIINELKWHNMAYYPFTLSFHDPDALWEFYIGRMLVMSVIDTKVLEEYFIAQRLRVELLQEDDFALRIIDPGGQDDHSISTDHKISRQFFNRLFAEFLGLEWMCYQICSLILAAKEI